MCLDFRGISTLLALATTSVSVADGMSLQCTAVLDLWLVVIVATRILIHFDFMYPCIHL
jgi:hypothetical protein